MNPKAGNFTGSSVNVVQLEYDFVQTHHLATCICFPIFKVGIMLPFLIHGGFSKDQKSQNLWKNFENDVSLHVTFLLLICVSAWNDILSVHILGQNKLIPNKLWRMEFRLYYFFCLYLGKFLSTLPQYNLHTIKFTDLKSFMFWLFRYALVDYLDKLNRSSYLTVDIWQMCLQS